MEERERANPTSAMASDPLSCYGANPSEAVPRSAFPSYDQSSDTNPLAFERLDASNSASRTIGHEPQHNLHNTELDPVAQQDSCLSQHRTANSLKSASNSVSDADVPRKYRLNKLSFSRDSHLWRSQDEPSLNQILEQERNAWLAHSPTDPCTFLSEHDLDVHTSCALPASSQPECRSNPHRKCRPNQSSPAGSPLKRKSCFQEGSMNEGSRAVASTWDTFHSERRSQSDLESQSELSDADGTPRALAPSRASMSSSIDINEFKPLPATPSTFRSTIRRLGQKVVNAKPNHTSECVTAPLKSDKKQRRGLKKSLSTWRFFSSSTSDVEDGSNLTSDDDFRGGKTNYSTKTIKPKKLVTNSALSQKEVLDERKRKAEIAYSEQFGSARKKQKQNSTSNHHDDHFSDWDEPSDSANSRQKDVRTSSTVRTMKSVLRKPTDNAKPSSVQKDHVAASSSHSVSDSHSLFSQHNERQSHDTYQSLDSDTDQPQRRSRDEIKKENQRIRTTLRGRDGKKSTRISGRQSRESSISDPCPDGPSRVTLMIGSSGEKGDTNINAAILTGTVQPKVEGSGVSPSISASNVQKLAPIRKPQPSFVLSNDIPPVPPLPNSLQQHRALTPVSGNNRPSKETATIKRRGPMRLPFDQNVLPRPLSMVLEGLEGENDEILMGGKQRPQFDGVTDDGNDKGKGCTEPTQSSHDPGRKIQHWDWPEDVF